MATPSIADVLVETLEIVGVERIYGIVGDSLNGITNALNRRKKITWVHVRHEEAAAFAAGAEAQLTGQLAVCAGSCGPGNLHLINGLYDSHRSYAPVLAIAAHIPSPEIGGNYFQETHPILLFQECSHFCEVVSTAEQMPRLLNIAIDTVLSKRGVAVLIISGDMALKKAKHPAPKKRFSSFNAITTPHLDEIEQIAKILNASKKITILSGSGCANAHDELMQVCEKLKSPVVHAMRGKEFVEYDNPFNVGMTGFIGSSSGYYAMESCETLLILGSDFPYRQFYPTEARIIQIDIRGEQLGKRAAIELGVIGDIKATLQALLPLLKENNDTSHLERAVKHYKKARKELDDLAVGYHGRKPIHPQFLAKLLDEIADDNAIFTCDVGTPSVWAARYLHMNGKRRLLGSFNHGSMANALSQAIGAQCAFPKRQVIALCGDGGFAMLMGEILTLIQEKLPIKVVIFNNASLGFVALEMKAGGMLEYGTDLDNPNFAKLADSIGIYGVRIEDPAHLEKELTAALEQDGPAIIDVVTNKLELVLPPVFTKKEIQGFSLYMARAILNGDGSEVYELVKTNLWR